MMKSESAPRLLSVGRICRDELLELEAWPAADTKTHIVDRLISLGGNAARAAVCAARLGARVSLAGRLGDDSAGRFCCERLQAAGVTTELVTIIPGGQTPCSHVLVCGAARTVLAETNRLEPLRMSAALAAAAQAADVILLDPSAVHLAAALKACSRAPLVYDHEPAAYAQAGIFELADYCVPGRASLNGALGTREAVAELAPAVAGQLIVTLGAAGACFLEAGRLCRIFAPPLAVRDTTGAGDNFHAALAVALARAYGLEPAVRFAVATASLSCRALGCAPPALDEALCLAGDLKVERL